MELESGIRILQALLESKKPPILKGHQSGQQILLGCLILILITEIPVFVLVSKDNSYFEIIDLVLGERKSLCGSSVSELLFGLGFGLESIETTEWWRLHGEVAQFCCLQLAEGVSSFGNDRFQITRPKASNLLEGRMTRRDLVFRVQPRTIWSSACPPHGTSLSSGSSSRRLIGSASLTWSQLVTWTASGTVWGSLALFQGISKKNRINSWMKLPDRAVTVVSTWTAIDIALARSASSGRQDGADVLGWSRHLAKCVVIPIFTKWNLIREVRHHLWEGAPCRHFYCIQITKTNRETMYLTLPKWKVPSWKIVERLLFLLCS